jgi:hypothetical protein
VLKRRDDDDDNNRNKHKIKSHKEGRGVIMRKKGRKHHGGEYVLQVRCTSKKKTVIENHRKQDVHRPPKNKQTNKPAMNRR